MNVDRHSSPHMLLINPPPLHHHHPNANWDMLQHCGTQHTERLATLIEAKEVSTQWADALWIRSHPAGSRCCHLRSWWRILIEKHPPTSAPQAKQPNIQKFNSIFFLSKLYGPGNQSNSPTPTVKTTNDATNNSVVY